MGVRVLWQDQYAFAYQTTSIGSTIDFATASGAGVGTSEYALPLINHPHIDAGLDIIDQRKAIGISQRSVATGHQEFLQGTKNPNSTWEFDGNAYNLAPFLWTLFQKGTTEGTGTAKFTKTYDPPTATEGPECEVWMLLLRKMEEATNAHSTRGTGFIVKSITLSADGFSPLRVSVELVGKDVSYVYDAQNAVFTYNTKSFLVWGGSSGATCEIDGAAVQLEGFTLTITNNAIARHYGGQDVDKFITSDYTLEGSISVFWGDSNASQDQETQLVDFVAGTDKRLHIYWGTTGGATTAGDLDILANIRYTGATLADVDTEIVTECPFVGVYDGTYDAIQIVLSDGIDRAIP